MRPLPREIARQIEDAKGLDPSAEAVARQGERLVPPGALKDLLSGTWLGHPLHPVLTDVPIGAWFSAGFLDVLGGKDARGAADTLIGLGTLAAIPTALAGLSDWLDTQGGSKRVGFVHAAGNVGALGLFALSLAARRSGHRGLGIFLSMLASAGVVGTAYLGGHLSFGEGIGVDHTAFERGPRGWKPIDVSAAELEAGRATRATVGDVRLLVFRSEDVVYAISDRCSHRGCSLSKGDVDGDLVVTCPCHGSAFRLEDGEVVRGPATAPQPAYDARIAGDRVEVRSR